LPGDRLLVQRERPVKISLEHQEVRQSDDGAHIVTIDSDRTLDECFLHRRTCQGRVPRSPFQAAPALTRDRFPRLLAKARNAASRSPADGKPVPIRATPDMADAGGEHFSVTAMALVEMTAIP